VKHRELSDEDLVYCYACGDVEAFDVIVSRYSRRLYGFAFRLLGDAQRAEDVVQEGFLRVHLHASRYKYGVAKFSTWVYRIVRNLAIQEMRKQRRRSGRELELPITESPGGGPDELAVEAEFNEAFQKALEGLPADQRTVFVLREVQNMSYKEIAKVVGVRTGTVRSRLNRARNALARALAPHLGRRTS